MTKDEEHGMSDPHPIDGLSITLAHASEEAPWVPLSMVISKPEYRHRITFTTERSLDEVFCPEVNDRLVQVLGELSASHSEGVFTNPDEVIHLPGLSLKQLRVIYSRQDGKSARAQVRFAAVVGNPHRALKSDDGFDHPLESLTSQVYWDALDQVLIPAVNIAAVDELSDISSSANSNLESAMNQLRGSKEQLLFQIELVKRELTRLEKRAYSERAERQPLLAAEADQVEFRWPRAIGKLPD